MPWPTQAGTIFVSGHFPSPTRVIAVDAQTGTHHLLRTSLLTNETEWDAGKSSVVIDLSPGSPDFDTLPT